MKKLWIIIIVILCVGIGSCGIYFFTNISEDKPIHGTFIKLDKESGDIGGETINPLFQSTNESLFV